MTRINDYPCPSCGTVIAGLGRPGDPVLCTQCRALLTVDVTADVVAEGGYGTIIGLRHPTDEEERDFLTNPAVTRAISGLARYHQKHGPPMSHRADDR